MALSAEKRLDRILEAQIGASSEMGLAEPTAFIVIGFWLDRADLAAIRPELRNDDCHPHVGEVGRYRSVPVYPADELPTDNKPYAYYEGVWYWYISMLCVN